jgi:hypothetical protein
MKQPFQIPNELREVMRDVAAKLDWADESLAGPDAIDHECARGGRIEGTDVFRITYFDRDGHGRWEIELRPQQIRDIAAGHLDEIEADQAMAEGTRTSARGEALLVWGEYDEDALRVRSPGELSIALDGLHAIAMVEPLALRLWSPMDDQAVAMINGNDCAIYVVRAQHGYGTSTGDPTRHDVFELTDHDLGPVQVPWSACVPWRVARPALLRFAELGEVGDHVILDGTIPSYLMMLGDYDRVAELETRRPPVADPAQTSLPRKAPHGAWATRLLTGFVELHLIEIDTSIQDAIAARLAVLLIQYGDDAIESPEVANTLAKEFARVRGVGALFATGGDLQIALRRTQDPPTSPVEIPFT